MPLAACSPFRRVSLSDPILDGSRHPPLAHSRGYDWLAARVLFGDDGLGQGGVFALHGSGAHRFIARCDSLSALQACLESILEIAIGSFVSDTGILQSWYVVAFVYG